MTSKINITYLENGALALAILVLGYMAGFFWTYTFNVNLAMQQVDGEIYATMQSLFNENVRHIPFFLLFFGGGFVPVLAILLNLRNWRQLSFWLIVIAAIVYILGIIFYTRVVNLPLNYYTESWNPQNLPLDWAVTRDSWNEANAFRVGTSATSFVLSVGALMSRTFKPGRV
ncbi:MAG: DUF1772 domain-containing protein [Ardenticatenaceae bacterium]|nr:DUF1772 domain-containing protein [Ardenticatenaceae bacterium]